MNGASPSVKLIMTANGQEMESSSFIPPYNTTHSQIAMYGEEMARLTGLEPATPGVTGRYSNQLSYNRASL